MNLLCFKKEDIKAIKKQMALDISLLSQFNLMDYSLLLCVQYNPEYVEKHREDFEEVRQGFGDKWSWSEITSTKDNEDEARKDIT